MKEPPMAHTCAANPCPICYPQPKPLYIVYPSEKGCICPPRSEETCKRPDCGRKPYDFSAGVNTR